MGTKEIIIPKVLSFIVKVVYPQSFGKTNNDQVKDKVLLKWSDQCWTPSTRGGGGTPVGTT